MAQIPKGSTKVQVATGLPGRGFRFAHVEYEFSARRRRFEPSSVFEKGKIVEHGTTSGDGGQDS